MFGKMFFVSVILLQVFTFGLGRSLQWLFAPWIGKIGRRWLMGISYFITNGLLVGLL
ncbi:metallophosphoesterase, partial [Neisseria sp. P0015.S006]